jgi:hypothetical protein
MLLSDWHDVYIRILEWVVGRHLPVKVKIDGALGYGFMLVSEQSVHEVVSEIRDAVNRVTDMLILLLFVPKQQCSVNKRCLSSSQHTHSTPKVGLPV